MINRSLASGSQQCLDQRIAFPLPRRASYCFSWTRKPRESDCAQFQSIPAFHRAVAGATARLVADAVAMATVFRCRPLQVVASVPSARADFAWDYRVQAISSAAKAGRPARLGHARGYASALSPSVADP